MSNYVTDEILLEINKKFIEMYEEELNLKINNLNSQNDLKNYIRMKVTVEELLDILHKINVTKLLVKKLEEKENGAIND